VPGTGNKITAKNPRGRGVLILARAGCGDRCPLRAVINGKKKARELCAQVMTGGFLG